MLCSLLHKIPCIFFTRRIREVYLREFTTENICNLFFKKSIHLYLKKGPLRCVVDITNIIFEKCTRYVQNINTSEKRYPSILIFTMSYCFLMPIVSMHLHSPHNVNYVVCQHIAVIRIKIKTLPDNWQYVLLCRHCQSIGLNFINKSARHACTHRQHHHY